MTDEDLQKVVRAGRIQTAVAVGLILFLATTAFAFDFLTRSESLFKWLVEARQNIDRQKKSRYSYEHYFVDFEDRLINEELPAADYSRGGVYLMGTSNLKWASRFWELPDQQRALIHNYGIGATSHSFQFHFLQFLVEQQGLLSAGGDKNMVVFGLSYHNVGPEYSPYEFFPSLWSRHGLYRYDVNAGITAVKMNALWRQIHFKRVRVKGLLKSVLSIAAHRMGYGKRVRIHDPAKYNRERAAGMGPNWQKRMGLQVSQFDAMCHYLQSRGVKVMVVLLPEGAWEDNLPFRRAYIDAVTKVCRQKSIPILDWSKLLEDDDFADSNHLTPSGVDKLQPEFLKIAERFLRSTGAL